VVEYNQEGDPAHDSMRSNTGNNEEEPMDIDLCNEQNNEEH